MKTEIFFVIILSVDIVSTFPQCPRPPDFTRELKDSYAMFMNILGYVGSRNFDKAHVVPWQTMKRKIYEQDPSVSLPLWTAEVRKLIDNLHFIDNEWFGNKKLQETPRKWREYYEKNKSNKRKCEEYLGKIDRTQIQRMKATNVATRAMRDLCQCIFSAPANIKPGYRDTNNFVGSHIDPLTTSKPEEDEVIECSDITERSKTIAREYDLLFQQYNDQYTGGGIVSSDQLPKARESPPKPFSTTQC